MEINKQELTDLLNDYTERVDSIINIAMDGFKGGDYLDAYQALKDIIDTADNFDMAITYAKECLNLD